MIDDDIAADSALRMARAGTGLLWRGDFHNARQLMRALDRRMEKRAARKKAKAQKASRDVGAGELFHATRLARSQRAAVLGRVLLELEPDTIRVGRRKVREACEHAYGRRRTRAGSRCRLLPGSSG